MMPYLALEKEIQAKFGRLEAFRIERYTFRHETLTNVSRIQKSRPCLVTPFSCRVRKSNISGDKNESKMNLFKHRDVLYRSIVFTREGILR